MQEPQGFAHFRRRLHRLNCMKPDFYSTQISCRSCTGATSDLGGVFLFMSDYQEKLKDPRWQKKRLEVLNRDGWKCRCCDADSKTLHVHHRYYVSGRDPWDYPDWCFMALCDKCHKRYESDYKGECDNRHEWETMLDCLFTSRNDDGNISLAEAVLKASERLNLPVNYILQAVESALRFGTPLESEFEKVRETKRAWTAHNKKGGSE